MKPVLAELRHRFSQRFPATTQDLSLRQPLSFLGLPGMDAEASCTWLLVLMLLSLSYARPRSLLWSLPYPARARPVSQRSLGPVWFFLELSTTYHQRLAAAVRKPCPPF